MPSDNVPPRPSTTQPQSRAGPSWTPDFMKYPYPETERILTRLETLPAVKEETKGCIAKLLHYRAVRTQARFPRGQSAAVLVPLFVGRSGDLYVLLSRRSDVLNAFAGDTALPGGKIDAQDVTVEDAARREAFEEVGLPQDKERMPLLCVMEPHLAKGEMLVTPVVVLILDNGLQPNLNSSEVTSIFAQPLISFLSSTAQLSAGRVADPNSPYHTFTDFPWGDGGTVRLHRFLTGREGEGVKPVFGLTASILIKTATVGYGRPPEFEVQPPNAPTPAQQISHALLTPANPLRIACEREGIDADETAVRLLRPPMAVNAARTIEWEKIGTESKKRVDGDDAAGVNTAVGEEKRSGSRSRRSPWDRNLGGEGLQKYIEEIKKGVQDQAGNGNGESTEGLDAKIEEYKKRTCERKEQREERGELGEERQDAIPNMAKLGEFLDKTQDMMDGMKEVKSEQNAKARKAHPRIAEQVKRQFEEVRNEDGKLDPKTMFANIQKQGWEGLRGGIRAGKGAERGEGSVGDSEGRDQGIERGREGTEGALEEMEKYVAKGVDGHNFEQARIPSKRDAKL
ncbi:hypothetical protein HD554DRAFT_594098 [Boletus coccyginus]|nr:hypothetical protein HD554DRAFT_594098 [Boletus coccyginus]